MSLQSRVPCYAGVPWLARPAGGARPATFL